MRSLTMTVVFVKFATATIAIYVIVSSRGVIDGMSRLVVDDLSVYYYLSVEKQINFRRASTDAIHRM